MIYYNHASQQQKRDLFQHWDWYAIYYINSFFDSFMVLAFSKKKPFLSQPETRSIKCIHVRYNTDEAIDIIQNVESYLELPKVLKSP